MAIKKLLLLFNQVWIIVIISFCPLKIASQNYFEQLNPSFSAGIGFTYGFSSASSQDKHYRLLPGYAGHLGVMVQPNFIDKTHLLAGLRLQKEQYRVNLKSAPSSTIPVGCNIVSAFQALKIVSSIGVVLELPRASLISIVIDFSSFVDNNIVSSISGCIMDANNHGIPNYRPTARWSIHSLKAGYAKKVGSSKFFIKPELFVDLTEISGIGFFARYWPVYGIMLSVQYELSN